MATASFKLVDGRLIQPEAFVRVWRAPLVPIALAFTSGIVLDRSCEIPLQLSLLVLLASLVTWVVVMKGGSTLMPPLCLAISSLAFGVAYYHLRMDTVSTDDLARLAKPEAQPIHFRGYLEQEPSILWQNVTDPLRSIPRTDPTLAVVEVTRRWDGSDWQMLHGRVQMSIDGHLEGFHAGDEIEVVGRLIAPSGPANPG